MSDPVTLTVTVDFTPLQLAEIFCQMDDEEQAQFFIEVSKIFSTWPGGGGMQTYVIGRHLATCECSGEIARDLIRDIANSIGPIL